MEFICRKRGKRHGGLPVNEESIVSDIGRACLMEIGYKSRWWARCKHVCEKFCLRKLVNCYGFGIFGKEGMAMEWRNGFGMNEREQQYLQVNSQSKWKCGSESEINGQWRLSAR